MAASIRKRASARRDMVERHGYLAKQAGIDFGDLALHPGMGAPTLAGLPQITGERVRERSDYETRVRGVQ